MSTAAQELFPTHPDFCNGVLHFGQMDPEFCELAATPAVSADGHSIQGLGDAEVYQTQLVADALRYTTLQLCAAKESGHPGGFASSADAYAALVMLGHTNIVTEVGHHAPGFYSAMFIDGSLEDMGIHTMQQLQARFRERDGLLGHLSGAIPGLLSPAGPLGQFIDDLGLNQRRIHIEDDKSPVAAIDVVDVKGDVHIGLVRDIHQLAAHLLFIR